MRVKITLSYDGSAFNGFQIQTMDESVQTVAGKLNEALKRLHIDVKITASGRTDAGVHALAQVVHIDLPEHWHDLEKLRFYLNRFVKPHLFIRKIEHANAAFNARFHAKKRLYRYVIYEGEYQPFLANYALHVNPIDVSKLDLLLKAFQGTHAFGYFKKVGGGATKEERTIFKAGAYRYKRMIVIYFQGDAFLRSQVRMMCDMVLKVANGELCQEDLIDQRDKKRKVTTTLAPACGLYLSRVYY
jgi:tRNA pseudouridine38-40 synthase